MLLSGWTRKEKEVAGYKAGARDYLVARTDIGGLKVESIVCWRTTFKGRRTANRWCCCHLDHTTDVSAKRMKEKKAGKTIWLSPLVSDKDFDVAFRDDHVHITVGPNYKVTPQQREEFWGAIIATCEHHNSHRILIEGYRPQSELTTMDVIEAGKLASSRPNVWIAFCLNKLFPAEHRELFEVVVASRHVRAKFFTDRRKALHWLRANAPT